MSRTSPDRQARLSVPFWDFAISVQNVPFGKVGQLQGETTFWRLADEHVRECKRLPVS